MGATPRDEMTGAGRGWGRRAVWVAVVAVGLVGVMMAGSLKAQAPLIHTPPTFGTIYKNYAGSDFQPFYNDTYNNAGVNALYSLGTGGGFFYTTRLNLPQGATITEVEFYYIDNDPAAAITFYLYQWNPSVNTAAYNSGLSTGASSAIQKFGLLFAPVVIDNTQYSYSIAANFGVGASGSNLQLLGARVGYRGPVGTLFYLPAPDRFVSTVDGRGGKSGPFVQNELFDYTLAGATGRDGNVIPVGAIAILGNVTAVSPTVAAGLFKILPGGTPTGTGTSTLNFNAGFNTANAFSVGLNPSGQLRAFYSSANASATSHLLVDVVGYYQ